MRRRVPPYTPARWQGFLFPTALNRLWNQPWNHAGTKFWFRVTHYMQKG